MGDALISAVVFAGFIFIIILANAIKIVQEYERGVLFRLGRVVGQRGPGLILIIPIIDRMVKVDLRIVALEVPKQQVITRDNVTIRVDAIVLYRVLNAVQSVIQAANFRLATAQISQTTLRSVLGHSELDELLAEREKINQRLQQIIDEQTEAWGVKVTTVEVKDVELPQEMQRAIARQAEAERERRAKIIAADGEFQAAERLSEAAKIIAREPMAMQLRFLQTLVEVSSENNTTTIFPVPIDLIRPFLDAGKSAREGT